MDSDANLLLAAEKLHLEKGLLRGQSFKGAFAFKRIESQTYLTVSEPQARILEEFAQPKTVPQVLEDCIRNRACPALREFYDLILKAHRAGVLRSEELFAEGPAPAEGAAMRWRVPFPALLLLILAAVAVGASLVGLLLAPPLLPGRSVDWFLGWLASSAALSLGSVLAACALHRAGAEVHAPHFRWFSLVPHFTVDLREACMTSGLSRAAVSSASLLPLGAAAAAGLWLHQAWSVVPCAALLLALRPIGGSALASLLLLLRRRPLLDTDDTPLFDAAPLLREKWRDAWKRFDGRIAGLQLGLGLAWALVIGATTYRLRHFDLRPVLRDGASWETALLGTAVALGVVALLWFAGELQYHLIDGVAGFWRHARVAWQRWFRRPAGTLPPEEVEALVLRNPLLRRLEPEQQLEFVARSQPLRLSPWRTLLPGGESAAFVGLIFSGRATVYRRLKSGRKVRLLDLIEGDLVGAHHLLDSDAVGLEVRAHTPLVIAAVSPEDFRQLVLDPLGSAVVSRYLDRHLFLQRASPLCAEWRPTAVARFAELASSASHPAGGKIIQQGEEVRSLYVLREGRARALRNRKALKRLEPGDFFGEISLLQTSAATADIETNDDARCLTVNRAEFIRFLSRNHHVALQMERLCSDRLGRPIFPLDGTSFEQR